MKKRLSFPIFRQPRAVTFGSGARREIAACVDPEQTVIFLSGNPRVQERLVEAWGEHSPLLDPKRICIKPAGEPTRETVRRGADFLTGRCPQWIIGIGGGSVLDWCRLAWAEAAGVIPTTLASSLTIPSSPSLDVPEFWLVPTTCATGAEAAAVAVVLDGGRKVPVISELFLATRAVLDGQFLTGANRRTMADAAGDALGHAIESFVSILQSPLAEDAAVGAIERFFAANDEKHPRHDLLMEAGYLGGLAASNASTGVAHAFAHSVARFQVPHGRAVRYALPVAIATNADTPAMRRLLSRLHLADVDALLENVCRVTSVDADDADYHLANRLEGGDRNVVVEAMLDDVCLRTNPVRFRAEDAARFVSRVTEVIRSS